MGSTKLSPVSLAMFYGANRDFANAFSVRVTLKNPIEPEPLRRAVDKAMERYPYFAVRLTVQGEDLVLEDNPLPVTIVAHQSMVKLIELAYPPRLKGSDIERLAICSRGMVMLQSQPETVWDTVRKQLALEKELEGLTLQEKFDRLRPIVTGARTGIGNLPASAPVSFKVSYVGRTDWGSMANMIESVHCSVTTDGSGICIEINTDNGYFDYCFMQEFEDDKYANTFVDLLEQEGIYCTVSGPYDVHVPKMRLPDEPEA